MNIQVPEDIFSQAFIILVALLLYTSEVRFKWIENIFTSIKAGEKAPSVKTSNSPTAIRISGGKGITVKDNISVGQASLLEAENVESLKAEGNVKIDPASFSKQQKVERDIWLLHAVHFIAYDSWEFIENPLNEKNITAGHDALDEIRQKAFDGSLPVWGKIGGGGLFKQIPKEYWEHLGFQSLTFMINNPEEFCTKNWTARGDYTIYNSLMTSKAKVEELWPVENT